VHTTVNEHVVKDRLSGAQTNILGCMVSGGKRWLRWCHVLFAACAQMQSYKRSYSLHMKARSAWYRLRTAG